MVRCRQQELATQEVRQHLDAGKQVSALGLEWNERIGFVLAEDLAVKAIKYSEIVQKDAGAEDEMAAMADSAASVEIVRMVTEGTPFYEIARHADELAVDAVVIAKTGQRDAREGLFFGSTAEKVVRACREPVIVLTHDA